MKTPYLVQRGEIIRPLASNVTLSKAVSFDYMGSSEFEWGALPKSLRALQSNADNIKLSVDKRITENEKSLRVLHTFSDEEFEEYFKYILRMRKNDIRLKENSRFAPDSYSKYTVCDVWWDIENHVFWSFDKIFMNRLGDHLVTSWKYMDEQKAKG